MDRVSEAIQSRPRGVELLVAGDFNVDLASLEGDRRAEDIRDVAGNGGTGRHGATLPAVGEQVVPGSEDVGDDQKGKGGAVLDGLHPGDGPPSLQERH